MKKIFASLAIAAAMFAFVACSSPVEKAKQYAADIEAAEAAGDYEKAAKLEKEMAEDKFKTRIRDISRPILSFPEDEPVGNIWEKFLEKKEHISVIIDEYGTFRGLVTLEDVIETMLGQEIVDETDEVVDMQEYAKEQWEKAQKDILK